MVGSVLGSIDLAVLVNAKEETIEGDQLPLPHVALEMVITAAHMPPDDRRRRRAGVGGAG